MLVLLLGERGAGLTGGGLSKSVCGVILLDMLHSAGEKLVSF